MRKLILATLLLGTVISVNAQSGTNSPYSQYGLGVLSDQTSGFNRGMNGVGLGFHEHNQINYLNPASYSAIDSLSFIFDAGHRNHYIVNCFVPRTVMLKQCRTADDRCLRIYLTQFF